MNIAFEQNGGSNKSYGYDCDSDDEITENTPIIKGQQNTRSFVVGTVSEEQYNKINSKIDWLKNGDGLTSRSGGLKVRLFSPGEKLEFDRELITTEDYQYPNKTVCYSTSFTEDVIEDCKLDSNTYRVVGVDMIWCRKDEFMNRLNQVING